MSNLVKQILIKDFNAAETSLEESFKTILERKMCEMKKKVAAQLTELPHDIRMKRLKMDVLEEEPEKSVKRTQYGPSSSSSTTTISDPKTGNNFTKNSAQIRLDKHGNEKSHDAPDEEGDEDHIYSKTTSTSNKGDSDTDASSTSTSTRRISSKVVRPDAGDGKGGDYEVKSSEDHEKSTETKTKKSSDNDKSELVAEARINIVKARIRGGKIQRRKKVSNVPGMTLRSGKLTRMSPAERRRRKLGAKKAARKAKAKRPQMLRKRKMSLMKRQRLGI